MKDLDIPEEMSNQDRMAELHGLLQRVQIRAMFSKESYGHARQRLLQLVQELEAMDESLTADASQIEGPRLPDGSDGGVHTPATKTKRKADGEAGPASAKRLPVCTRCSVVQGVDAVGHSARSKDCPSRPRISETVGPLTEGATVSAQETQ